MKTAAFLISSLLLIQIPLQPATSVPTPPATPIAPDDDSPTPQQVRETAKNITVRVTADNGGGSGVIIAQKGANYLVLTNAHVIRRATRLEIQAPDGRKYTAKPIDGGFDSKSDLALLQFTSQTKYTLADLSDVGSTLEPERAIYSAGFPFDSREIGITSGKVSQLSDIPFDDGTQIGYVTGKGEKGIRQGMSGGAILDARGKFLGINTVGVAPILPDYTYNDGSKPLPKLVTKYRQANWGIPVYNFLTNVKADILYGYDNLPKVQRQVTPTGYMAKLSQEIRQKTVRIENSGGNGSGVIVAREGSSYYVLTAKHVVKSNIKIITYDQDIHNPTSTVVAEGVDLAIVKFSSNSNYPLARLGEYNPNNRDLVFVGGFPERAKINSPLWQWQLNPGFINAREQGKLQTQNNESFSEGYDLIYSSISYGGMSGGPIFNTEGNVIGIHGREESTELNSLGISIQTFTGLLDKLQIAPNLLKIAKNPPVELNPGDRNNVIAAMQNIPQPQAEDEGTRWLAYGNQLYRTSQYNKSIAAFEQAIAKGEVLLGSYGKALSLAETGKYQLAEKAIAQAIAAIPTRYRTTYYYFWKKHSLILRSSEKYNEALKAIDIAISLVNNDLTLLTEKAGIFSRKKQYVEAISIYDEIIRKQPEAYAYSNRGNAKSDLGDNQAAIVDYNRAIALNPKDAVSYYNRGIAKYDLGDKQGAIINFDRAIALNFKYTKAYYNRGIAKYNLGDKQAAIIDFDRAIALDSKYTEAYYNRGISKSDLGDKQAAIIDFDRAIALDRRKYKAYTNRGVAKFDLGDKKGAIADYDRAIALNPKDAITYYNRGIVKHIMRDKQGAILDYNSAIALNPKDAKAYYSRGVAKYDLRDKQASIADYNSAIALNPKYAEAYANRGVAKQELGDKHGGITDMSKAADLFRQQGRMSDYQKVMDLLKKWQGN